MGAWEEVGSISGAAGDWFKCLREREGAEGEERMVGSFPEGEANVRRKEGGH